MGRETELRDELAQLRARVLDEMVSAWPGDAPMKRDVLERAAFEGPTITFLIRWVERLAAEVDELHTAIDRGSESGGGSVGRND